MKKHMKKRAMSLFMAVVMVISLIPAMTIGAFAVTPTEVILLQDAPTGGIRLTAGETYYIDQNTTINNSKTSKNGLIVEMGAPVTLCIPAGVTLTVYGKDGTDGAPGGDKSGDYGKNGQVDYIGGSPGTGGGEGGGAAIYLPSGATLNVVGGGNLVVYGGNAGDGGKGGNGGDSLAQDNDETDEVDNKTSTAKYYIAGGGGGGGQGGGGGGAGIGTNGGTGGAGGAGGAYWYWTYDQVKKGENDNGPQHGALDGKDGDNGSAGKYELDNNNQPVTMGNLNVSTGITISGSGGDHGSFSADQGKAGVGDTEEDDSNDRGIAGGAGGGGGGAGYGGALVGTGGSGGGGGGGGGNAGYLCRYFYVGGGGGGGGAGGAEDRNGTTITSYGLGGKRGTTGAFDTSGKYDDLKDEYEAGSSGSDRNGGDGTYAYKNGDQYSYGGDGGDGGTSDGEGTSGNRQTIDADSGNFPSWNVTFDLNAAMDSSGENEVLSETAATAMQDVQHTMVFGGSIPTELDTTPECDGYRFMGFWTSPQYGKGTQIIKADGTFAEKNTETGFISWAHNGNWNHVFANGESTVLYAQWAKLPEIRIYKNGSPLNPGKIEGGAVVPALNQVAPAAIDDVLYLSTQDAQMLSSPASLIALNATEVSENGSKYVIYRAADDEDNLLDDTYYVYYRTAVSTYERLDSTTVLSGITAATAGADVHYVEIVYDLDHANTSPMPNIVKVEAASGPASEDLAFNVTAMEGYKLPDSVQVTQGSTTIGASYARTSDSTGTLTIAKEAITDGSPITIAIIAAENGKTVTLKTVGGTLAGIDQSVWIPSGSHSYTKTISTMESLPVPVAPANSATVRFAGWYDNVDYDGNKYTNISSADNVNTLYAKWEYSDLSESGISMQYQYMSDYADLRGLGKNSNANFTLEDWIAGMIGGSRPSGSGVIKLTYGNRGYEGFYRFGQLPEGNQKVDYSGTELPFVTKTGQDIFTELQGDVTTTIVTEYPGVDLLLPQNSGATGNAPSRNEGHGHGNAGGRRPSSSGSQSSDNIETETVVSGTITTTTKTKVTVSGDTTTEIKVTIRTDSSNGQTETNSVKTERETETGGTGIYVAQVMTVEGNYVTINYIVENRSDDNYITAENPLNLGAVADVMIGSNDRAKVVRAKTNDYTYLQMNEGSSNRSKVFRLFLEGEAYGVTDVDRYWVGSYGTGNRNSGKYWNNAFNDTSTNANNGYDASFNGSGDSALAYSWTLDSLAPGESVVKTVKLGVGDLEAMSKVNLTLNANGGEFVIEGLCEAGKGVDILPLNGTTLEIEADGSVIVDGKNDKPYPVPQREGYNFGGWVYANGSPVSAGPVKADTSIYASWTQKVVNYDVKNNSVVRRTLDEGNSVDLTSPPAVAFLVDGKAVEQGATATDAATKGQDLSVEMSVPDGYLLPLSVTVTVGDKTLTPGTGYRYDTWNNQEKASLLIYGSEITGDVVIRALAHPAPAKLPDSFVAHANGSTSVTIQHGRSVNLTATADPDEIPDHEDFSYQWYKTTDGTNQGGTPIASGLTLTVGNDLPVGSYYYYCVLTSTRSNGEEATMTTEPVLVSVAKIPTTTSLSMPSWRHGDTAGSPSATVRDANDVYVTNEVSVDYYTDIYGLTMTDTDVLLGGAAEKGGKPTLPGTYYAIATYEGAANYEPSESTLVKFTIYGTLNVPMDGSALTVPDISDLVYNGTLQKPAIWDTDDYIVVENNGGTNVGDECTVTLEIKDKEQYRWANAVGGAYTLEADNTRAIVKYQITKAPLDDFTVTKKDVSYAGAADGAITVTLPDGADGWEYSTNPNDQNSWVRVPGDSGTTVTELTAGKYYVRIVPDSNHHDLNEEGERRVVEVEVGAAKTNVTVTFKANGGTDGTMSEQEFTYNVEGSLNANTFTREGYTFTGWNTKADGIGGTAYTNSQSIRLTGDVTLYAQWQVNTYTVTFDPQNGSEAFTQNVDHGNMAIQPAEPTRDGFIFAGWKNGNDGWNFSTPITDNITLTAQWTQTYKVTFDANEGTGAPVAQTKIHDVALTLSNVIPTKSGSFFTGWNTEEHGNGTPYQPGASYTENEAVTLYAQWEAIKCTVTFNSDGGSAVPPQNVTSGEKATAPSAPTKSGYTFLGWYVAENTPWNFDTQINENITLTAHWRAITYTVTVTADGNGTATANPASGVSGTMVTLTVTPDPGWHFKEWQVVSGGVTIDENNRFTIGYADVEVKAIFEEDTFTVTVTNDGNGTATANPASGVSGTEVTLTAVPDIGYHFKEWKVISDNVTIDENNRFTLGSEHVAVQAIFKINSYTITPPAPGTGFTVNDILNENTVNHGGSYAFTVTLDEGYSGPPVVTYSGSCGNIDVVKNQNGTFAVTIYEIHSDGSVAIDGIADKTAPVITVKRGEISVPNGATIEGNAAVTASISDPCLSKVELNNGTLIWTKADGVADGWDEKVIVNDTGTEVSITGFAPSSTPYIITATDASNNTTTFTVTVKVSLVTYAVPYVASMVYNGKEQRPAIWDTDDYDVEEKEVGPNVGTYEVTLTLTKPNYQWTSDRSGVKIDGASATIPFRIIPAENEFTKRLTVAHNTVAYGSDPAPYAEAKFGTDNLYYQYSQNKADWSSTPNGVGTWYVRAVVPADLSGNYPALESIPLAFTVVKADRPAPTVTRVHETFAGKHDGHITVLPGGHIVGLTNETEYRTAGTNWNDVSAIDRNLAPGTYYVRYKETDNYKASATATVTINPGSALTVTFDANDGTGTKSTQNFTYNVEQYLDANVFTREGYTFDGWNTNEGGTGDNYADGAIIKLTAANITLYAQWQVNTYTVTFDPQNGSEAFTQNVDHGNVAIQPAEPTRDGFIFAGWKNGNDGWNFSTPITDNITLTAQWTQTYTVTFASNGGTDVVAQTVAHGGKVTEPSTPGKTGYTFAGWKNGDAAWDFENSTVTGDITLTAQWTPNTYTVTFYANGGTGDTMSPQEFTYDVARNLTTNTFTCTDYIFTGWNTEEDGGGTTYVDGASVMNLTAVNGGTVSLYAQWAQSAYTVTFYANGGSETMNSQKVPADQSATLIANAFTREGYTFTGWNTEANGNGDTYTNGHSITLTGDIALYAQWVLNTYTVTFDANGGSAVASRTVDHGGKVTQPSTPSRTGYTFAGWKHGNDSWDFVNGTVTGDITLTARWEANTYTVTFDTNGGSGEGSATAEAKHDGTVAKPADPAKENYTFAGWYTEQNGGNKWDFESDTVTEDMTLYAQWVLNTYTVTFDANGGSAVASQTVDHGGTVTQPANPTRNGYTFAGWTKDGNEWNFERDTVTEAITLTAQWQANTGTVTVASGTGFTASLDTGTVSYDGSFTFHLTILPGYGGTPTATYNGTSGAITVAENQNGTFTVTVSNIRTFGTVTVSGIEDVTNPTVSVTLNGVETKKLMDTVTFNQYFSGAQTVSIAASDSQSGVEKVEYLVSSSDDALTEDQLKNSNEWISGSSVIIPAGSGKKVVYARATDYAGNVSYASTNGAVFDNVAPVIVATLNSESGEPVTSGSIVTGTVIVKVTDNYQLKSVTGAGEPVNGVYTLNPSESNYMLIATDKAGNMSYFSVTSKFSDTVQVPILTTNSMVYTGELQKPVISDVDGVYTVTANAGGTDVGIYYVELTLSDKNLTWTTVRSDSADPIGAGPARIQINHSTGTVRIPYAITPATNEWIQYPELQVESAHPEKASVVAKAMSGAEMIKIDDGNWQNLASAALPTIPGTYNIQVKADSNPNYTALGPVTLNLKIGVDVNGSVSDSGAGRATVELMKGNQKIKEESITLTKPGDSSVYTGTYKFEYVLPGMYNIVVTKGTRTMTVLIKVEDDMSVDTIKMPTANKNSVLDNSGAGEFAATVGGLDEIADSTVLGNGENKVVIKLKVTAETANSNDADHSKIQQMASGRELNFIDLTLTKQIDGNTPVDIGSSNAELLTIVIPFDRTNKADVMVYRCHNGSASAMTPNPDSDEEGFVVGADRITIYAKRFSTYAIGYTASGVTPPADPGTTPSGGGSSAPSSNVTTEKSENGSVESKINGDTATITPKPDAGYVLDSLEVTDKNGNKVDVTANPDGTYSFKMPEGGATVKATFVPVGSYAACVGDHTCPIYPYTDAQPTAWYHDGVHYCIENGYMKGISTVEFAPAMITNRAMIATILWRMEGEPIADYDMTFEDVADGLWYTEAIRWAQSVGVVEGYSDEAFGPNDSITREQMATILYRYCKYKGIDVSVGEDTNILSYEDAFDISNWAMEAMQWACGSGMIEGIAKDGTMYLDPQGNAIRCQSATMIYRFCEELKK